MFERFLHSADEGFSKDRFAAFTDGVFAVAITLLIVDFRVPEIPHVNDEEMRAYLLTLGRPVLAYLLTFFSVGIAWMNFHGSFKSVERVDRPIILIALCNLSLVCFMPFPTALLARYGAIPSSTALYGGLMLLMGFFGSLLPAYARAQKVAAGAPVPRLTGRFWVTRLIGLVFYGVGALVAFAVPTMSIALYVCAAVYYMAPGVRPVK